jgi:flagellum-specific peptidoglycan hydrolase FlgJ
MKTFNVSLFMLVVTIVAYCIVERPREKAIDYKTSVSERSHSSGKMISREPVEHKHIHAGADELYPDVGYDEDGWSKRGYMSTSEFQGSHLKGDQEKLAKLKTRIGKERQAFVDDISKNAKDLSAKFNIPASIIAAQAILESGYGTSRLAVVANNLFGHMGGKTKDSRGITGSIKAYDKNINGHTISYGFRIYESKWWSMWNHVQLLNKTYAPRLINTPNKREAWLAAICGCSDSRMLASDSKRLADKGGYLYASACAWPASDGVTSRYVAELRHIINSYNLSKLDE